MNFPYLLSLLILLLLLVSIAATELLIALHDGAKEIIKFIKAKHCSKNEQK